MNSEFLHFWTIKTESSVADAQSSILFPRRWLSAAGAFNHKVWLSGLKNVVGWIWTRPGIPLVSTVKHLDPNVHETECTGFLSQVDILRQMRHVFDRMEALELLQALVNYGVIEVLKADSMVDSGPLVGYGVDEASFICFKVRNEAHWYSLGE